MTEVDLAAARAGIDAFWSAWPGVRGELDRAVAAASTAEVVELISPLVSAVHPELAWEHAKGIVATNALVVSAEGNRMLRSTAERWLRAAPAPDEDWEFHAARQADPAAFDFTMQLEGVDLPLAETRVSFDVDAERKLVDVVVHHPALRRLEESQRTTFMFLVLNWLLGEDGVERWIGTAEFSTARWFRGGSTTALRAAVDEIARAGGDGDWVLLETRTEDDRPVIAVAMARLNPVDWPLLDLHVAVELPYEHQNEGGFPLEPSSAALNAFEDELTEQLGEDGLVVARESFGGIRTIHAYVDAECDAVATARELAPTWSEGEARVRSVFDPAWSSVAHLRT